MWGTVTIQPHGAAIKLPYSDNVAIVSPKKVVFTKYICAQLFYTVNIKYNKTSQKILQFFFHSAPLNVLMVFIYYTVD